MEELDQDLQRARRAVAREIEKKKLLRQPIARFDAKTGQIYMENGDGTITVVGNITGQGRYSERKRKET